MASPPGPARLPFARPSSIRRATHSSSRQARVNKRSKPTSSSQPPSSSATSSGRQARNPKRASFQAEDYLLLLQRASAQQKNIRLDRKVSGKLLDGGAIEQRTAHATVSEHLSRVELDNARRLGMNMRVGEGIAERQLLEEGKAIQSHLQSKSDVDVLGAMEHLLRQSRRQQRHSPSPSSSSSSYSRGVSRGQQQQHQLPPSSSLSSQKHTTHDHPLDTSNSLGEELTRRIRENTILESIAVELQRVETLSADSPQKARQEAKRFLSTEEVAAAAAAAHAATHVYAIHDDLAKDMDDDLAKDMDSNEEEERRRRRQRGGGYRPRRGSVAEQVYSDMDHIKAMVGNLESSITLTAQQDHSQFERSLLFPSGLVQEIDHSHKMYSRFANRCRELQAHAADPLELLRAYEQLLKELTVEEMQLNPGYSSHQHRQHPHKKVHSAEHLIGDAAVSGKLDQVLDASPRPSSASSTVSHTTVLSNFDFPNTAIMLCVSHLLDTLCSPPNAQFNPVRLPAYSLGMLKRLVHELQACLFDVAFQESSGFQKTPHFARLKHLRLSYDEAMTGIAGEGLHLYHLMRSLRLVIRHNLKRMQEFAFRAWRSYCFMEKQRDRMYHHTLTAKTKPHNRDTQELFFYKWRFWTRRARLSSMFSTEVAKLTQISARLTKELGKKKVGEHGVQMELCNVQSYLAEVKRRQLAPPTVANAPLNSPLIYGMLDLCREEMVLIQDMREGFAPIFLFASSHWENAKLFRLSDRDMRILLQQQRAPDEKQAILERRSLDYERVIDERIHAMVEKADWFDRKKSFAEIGLLRDREEKCEIGCYEELLGMDTESFLLDWVNKLLEVHPTCTRQLRDLSTDLRDGTVYLAVLNQLCPEMDLGYIEVKVDLHERASLILDVCKHNMVSEARLCISEYDFVDGNPAHHLLLLGQLFLARAGLPDSPSSQWLEDKASLVSVYRGEWRRISGVAEITHAQAQDMLCKVHGINAEFSIMKQRLIRRKKYNLQLKSRVEHLTERILHTHIYVSTQEEEGAAATEAPTASTPSSLLGDAKARGGTDAQAQEPLPRIQVYHVKHVKNKFHSYVDDGTVAAVLGPQAYGQLAASVALEEYNKVKKIFGDRRDDLKEISAYYASMSADTKGLNWDAYMEFAEDCFLTKQPNAIEHGDLCIVFVVTRLGQEEVESMSEAQLQRLQFDATSRNHELLPHDFLNCLLRLANIKYAKMYHKNNIGLRLTRFLDDDVLPRAGRTVVYQFRKSISSTPVRDVFKMFSETLVNIYKRYSQLDRSDRNLKTMNLDEWLALAQDANFDCSREQLRVIFNNVQQDVEFGDVDASMKSEMSYQEFMEALAAVAVLHIKDPFMPLAHKIERWFTVVCLPQLKKRFNAQRKGGSLASADVTTAPNITTQA